MALFFGSLKPIGILASLIIVPLTSLFMVFSLAALAVSFFPFPLWDLFNVILTWIYRFMENIVFLAGRVPGIAGTNPIVVLAFTIIFWLLILFAREKDKAYRDSFASFD